MPHDKNGRLVQVGQRVSVEFTVERVYETEGGGYCNAELRSVEPMYPTDNKSSLTINARQCEVVAGDLGGGVELVSGDAREYDSAGSAPEG